MSKITVLKNAYFDLIEKKVKLTEAQTKYEFSLKRARHETQSWALDYDDLLSEIESCIGKRYLSGERESDIDETDELTESEGRSHPHKQQ